MKRGLRFLAAVGLLVMLSGQIWAATPANRYLIKFKNDMTDAAATAELRGQGLSVERMIPELGIFVAVPARTPLSPAAFAKFRAQENVSYAEENGIVRAIGDHEISPNHLAAGSPSALAPLTPLTPNDPLYPQQAPLKRMNVEAAWDLGVGSGEVIIAITDTGLALQQDDLKTQIWQHAGERGWNFADGNGNTDDNNGHGTHVAGIAAAEGDNTFGIAGVIWDAQVMPIKFLGADGSGTTEHAIDAILYAVHNHARLINASWGGTEDSRALRAAIEYAYDRGALLIAAAGNGSLNTDLAPEYPADFKIPGVLAVTSSFGDGQLSSFANYGAISVALATPGENVLSTLPGNVFGRLSGTSMAAPMATGVGALILSLRPDLTPLELRNAILNAVNERTSYGGLLSTQGDLDAGLAVQQLTAGFQVWPSRITVPVKGTVQFTPFSPQGPVGAGVRWRVSDPAIARIDASGTLVGFAPGEVQVEAIAPGGLSARTRWVKVIKPPGTGAGTGGGGCGMSRSEAFGINYSLPLVAAWVVRRRRRRTPGRDLHRPES